ncbi:hypothetical protein [Streptomyces mirabilis]|uniref:hypothetical protein n=1 Tax=Streptomyces mirabilis TaxID=68239 RepID=UPI0038063FB8
MKPSPSPSSDPVGYLYNVDRHRHPQADVQKLVAKISKRCADNTLVLEFAATNTATDLVDVKHATQDVYPVLAQVTDGLPASGKVDCQKRLPAAGKAIQASR